MRTPKRYEAAGGTVSWTVRFRLDGHQTSETFTGPRADKRALKFAKTLDALGPRAALKQLEEAEGRGIGPLLDNIAEEFFVWKEPKVRSDRTVADYRRDYRNWIKPTFGSDPADTITEVAVQQWVDAMSEGKLGAKLSPKSVADRHAILFAIFKWATAPGRKLLAYNPCIGTDLPPKTKTPPKGLRPAEWQALHPALAQVDPDAADLALFLVSTGWRFSEGGALTAYAVEDYTTTLYVSMGQVIRRNAAGQHVIVPDGKGDASLRRIQLDPEAADTVRRRLEHVQGDGLVFTNARGHQWHYANFLNRSWNPAVKLAGLTRRPTPHWLRHTHVGWLVMSGKVSLAEIQRRIGHESIDTTIGVYGRMVDDVSADALAGFAAIRNQLPKATKPPELET